MKVRESIFPDNWDPAQKRKRDQYWRMLRTAKAEYDESQKTNFVQPPHHEKYGGDTSMNSFYYFMQNTYGVKMGLTGSKEITGEYTIVDEKKYTMFLLKYGSSK